MKKSRRRHISSNGKWKKNKVYVPGAYISPFVVALAAGVNSNPSSRERFFLRTANPRQDPNSCIHYDVIWRYYSSISTGGRHQVMQQQTGSEPPNRCPPDLPTSSALCSSSSSSSRGKVQQDLSFRRWARQTREYTYTGDHVGRFP